MYQYDRAIDLGPQVIRLKPAGHSKIHTQGYALSVSPQNGFVNDVVDEIGNNVVRCVFPERSNSFSVQIDFLAYCDEKPYNPFDFFVESTAEKFPPKLTNGLDDSLSIYLRKEKFDWACINYFNSISRGQSQTVDFIVQANSRISEDIILDVDAEQTARLDKASDIVRRRKANTPEMCWLLMQLLRYHSIASRFVSGYEIFMEGIGPYHKHLKIIRDEIFLSGWVEAFIPGAGWIAMSPLYGVLCDHNFIPVAVGPHPRFCASISGSVGQAEVAFSFEMSLTRMDASTLQTLSAYRHKEGLTATAHPGTINYSAIPGLSAKLNQKLAKLDSLIGLSAVKDEVKRLIDVAILNKKREAQALSPLALSLHLVFTGNPGTGKTTVARLIGDIYASLGLLRKGHLVEIDKGGLVAPYLGQTAIKTKGVIDDALDGVLFVDEAYSLTREGSGNQYGQEAMDTLLKEMEDKRGRLLVIVAGYPDEMHQFILSNPGLKSRFTTYVNFEDYTPDELSRIFSRFAENEGMRLSDDARTKVRQAFQIMHDGKAALAAKGEVFGNGRNARNLFEQAVKNVAARVAAGDTNLQEIQAEDIPGGLVSPRDPNHPGGDMRNLRLIKTDEDPR